MKAMKAEESIKKGSLSPETTCNKEFQLPVKAVKGKKDY